MAERSLTFENNSISQIDIKIIGLPPELLNPFVRVIADLLYRKPKLKITILKARTTPQKRLKTKTITVQNVPFSVQIL